MPPVRMWFATLTLVAIGSIASAQFPPSYDDAPLRAVYFADTQEGWAVGDHGVIWHTTDGGTRWERQKSGTRASLRSVCFLTPYTGFAAGRIEQPYGMVSNGVVLKTTDGGLTWQEIAAGILPGLNAVKFLNAANGVVIGDPCPAFPSGVFKTTDGGENWVAVPEKQAREQLPAMGMELGQREAKHNSERKTGQPLPIHAQQMIDATTGFTVGDLGTILATTDGGKSWQVRKCGGQRAAVLFIHATPDAVPLDAIALLGAKDGYYCQALSVTSSDQAEKLHAAVRLCGGSGAEACGMFPNPRHLDGLPAKAILAYWDTFHAGKAHEQLLRQLVLAIRTWQPEVLVTDREATGLEQLVMLAAKEAFKLAADPKAFPEQIEHLGLKVHAAKKLYCKCDMPKDASVTYDHATFCTAIGNYVRDFCESGVNQLGPAAAIPSTRMFRLVGKAMDGADKHHEVMEGIALPRGGTARRMGAMPQLPEQYLAMRQGFAAARRKVESLAANPDLVSDPEKFLVEVRKSLSGMPEDVACRTVFAAGDRLARDGRWGLAREIFAFVSDQFAAHSEAAFASRWLLQYHASSSVLRRIELGQVNPIPAGVFESLETAVKPAGGSEPVEPRQLYRFTNGQSQRVWSRFCLDLETRLVAFGPVHAKDPLVQACVVVAKDRGAVTTGGTAKLFDGRPEWACLKATKPVLDGKLTDECWEKASKVPLAGPAGYDAEARFAYDDQYLYISVTCKHPTGKQVSKVEKRDRDADLRGHDRIEWLLDLDGSGATPFRFAVDHRGCLAEDCWGAKDWNPKWYVAFESAAESWTAEVAIPLVELTDLKLSGQSWGVRVTRTIPGTGEPSTAWAKMTFGK